MEALRSLASSRELRTRLTDSADLLRMAALLLGHWEGPSSLVAPCPARNYALSLGVAVTGRWRRRVLGAAALPAGGTMVGTPKRAFTRLWYLPG